MLTNNPINHSVLKLSMDFDNAFKHKNIEEIHRLIEFCMFKYIPAGC